MARDSPKGPFVRDIDFSYMDVTRAGSMESKTKGPAFDKEKSLQRYSKTFLKHLLLSLNKVQSREANSIIHMLGAYLIINVHTKAVILLLIEGFVEDSSL